MVHEIRRRGESNQRSQPQASTFRNPSAITTIANAVTIKEEEPFYLAQTDADVPGARENGYGLYFRDCQFLSCFELRVDGKPLTSLIASAAEDFAAYYELSNPPLPRPDGTTLEERSLGVRVERLVVESKKSAEATLHQAITVENYSPREVDVSLTVGFDSDFRDVFEVRGLVEGRVHNVRRQVVDPSLAVLADDGTDDQWRTLSLSFDPPPESLTEREANYHLNLQPNSRVVLALDLTAAIGSTPAPVPNKPAARSVVASMHNRLTSSHREWLGEQTRVTTSNQLFNLVLERSLLDLRMLRTRLDADEYFAAGLPWFGTLFGRDSVISALQTLAFDATVAEKTLRVLAQFQGTRDDPRRDERPGKILHELRVGELARSHQIPSPYYGSVDSTPLFLILLAEHYAWSGDRRVFHDLRQSVNAALRWIDTVGEHDRDGFLAYGATGQHGYLRNQGWKDSADAITNADGSLATPPIALVEVQGYVYLVKCKLADLFAADGDAATAARLRQEAARYKDRFNDRFWLPDRGIYALALQKDGRPAAVMSSNPGQALWGEIIAAEHRPALVKQLMAPAMFGGWGVRTLAATEKRYNPIGYHLGTVWPHDNSIIAAGLRKYCFDADAQRIFTGVFEAASHFTHYRLPELFAGFERSTLAPPAHYPVACHPQAWAAGSVPFLLQTALGLTPDAPNATLRVVRPCLPPWLDQVELSGLRIGSGGVDLRFSRDGDRPRVEVVATRGGVQVKVDDSGGPVA